MASDLVFLPVVFLTGQAKSLFTPLALTISFSLAMSFLVSRTVTPLLCIRHLKVEGHAEGARGLGGYVARQLDRMDKSDRSHVVL